ncbi:MAG: C4-dicarboxylate ABC transporter, partial [Proteobacteria bacterium]|nr:C4-dicarboxylate ABC transporter [Pseudomonadota bacterium]
SSKFHEVQIFLTMTDHGYHGSAVITNKKFWNDLPPDIRSTVEGALKDATAFFNNSAKKDNDDALEDIRKSGKTQIIILAPAERLAWKRAMVQVHQEWGKKLGEEILQAIYRETHFDPNTL